MEKAQRVRERYQSEHMSIADTILLGTPVRFNTEVTEGKFKNQANLQSFVFRASQLSPFAGMEIIWKGEVYRVIRGKGNFYYNDEFGLDIVVQCIKNETD